MGGVSESQLPTGRWYSLNVLLAFPREMSMRYHWTLLRARWEGLKVGRDDVKVLMLPDTLFPPLGERAGWKTP